MVKMLPTVEIKYSGKHAYVLPLECIRHFLAFGNEAMNFDSDTQKENYMQCKDTPRGIAIAQKSKTIPLVLDNTHLKLSLIEWIDDCKSAKSNKTSKTGSLWVWTITIFHKDKKSDSPAATFPIAIGPKNESHDKVEGIIAMDLQKMASEHIPAFI